MMTITSDTVNTEQHNNGGTDPIPDSNSPVSHSRVNDTDPLSSLPLFSPTRTNDTLASNQTSSPQTRNNCTPTLSPAAHNSPIPLTIPAAPSPSSSPSNKQQSSSSSSAQNRYADLEWIDAQRVALSINSNGIGRDQQYADIKEVRPKKVSANAETTTV